MFQQTTPLSNGAESTNDYAAALPSTPRCEESSGFLNEVFEIGKSFAFIFNNSYEALPMNYFSFSDYCLPKLDEMRERVRLRNTSNTLRLNRPYYVQAAINASQSSQFMQDVRSKLVIVFKGEEGVDGGGLRKDFFSNLFHRFETILVENRRYMEGEPTNVLSEMEFAAGVFSAIAVLQDDFYHPVVIELLKTGGPRFVDGLNVYENFGHFLQNEPSVHFLFKRCPVTPDKVIALLRRDPNSDQDSDMIEKINFNFISKFLNDVHGKKVVFCIMFYLLL